MPFIVCDALFILSLHFLERQMKAEKKVQETEELTWKETEKASTKAMMKETRDAQKREAKLHKPPKSTSSQANRWLQQPSKKMA